MSAAESEDLESLLQFLYMVPMGLAQTRIDGTILMINPSCSALLMPLSQDGELSNLFEVLEQVAPDVREQVGSYKPSHGMVLDSIQLQVDPGQPGRRKPQILSLSLLKLRDDLLMAVISDVSVAVQRDRQLRESNAWIESLISGVSDYALVSLDAAGCVRNWNAGIGRITGFSAVETVDHSYAMFYPEEDLTPRNAMQRLQEADEGGWSLDEGWRRRRDGSLFWGSCLVTPLHSLARESSLGGTRRPPLPLSLPMPPAPPLALPMARAMGMPVPGATSPARPEDHVYSLIIRDISDQRETRGALRQAAYRDHLTGLANRRAFHEAARREVERCSGTGRALSLVMLDADHFKAVNDKFGHATGDAVLRHLAGELVRTFRTDSAARIGGEEFAVLLPGITLDEALGLATRLCETVSDQTLDADGEAVRFTVSAGVAALAADADGLDALLKRADAALYQAKSKGRNRAECWRTIATRTADQPA